MVFGDLLEVLEVPARAKYMHFQACRPKWAKAAKGEKVFGSWVVFISSNIFQ